MGPEAFRLHQNLSFKFMFLIQSSVYVASCKFQCFISYLAQIMGIIIFGMVFIPPIEVSSSPMQLACRLYVASTHRFLILQKYNFYVLVFTSTLMQTVVSGGLRANVGFA